MNLSVELYKEDNLFCVYIGEDCSSGYSIKCQTPSECGERVKQYVINRFLVQEEE